MSRLISKIADFVRRLYVNSSYIKLLRSPPASICENCPTLYTSLYLCFHPCEESRFPPGSNPFQHLSVHTLLLGTESQRLLSTENAGGSSIESEVLSFEVMKRILPYWELSSMEMTTKYSSSGPMTDFVARSCINSTLELSVSVTRIFGWSASMRIGKSALTPLLLRKLSGLRCATSRILPRRKRGMVLFVWVPDGAVEKNVRRVWNKLCAVRHSMETTMEDGAIKSTATIYGCSFDPTVTDNVIVFVGVCKRDSWMNLEGWRKAFGKHVP